jgi:chemotaxis protein methyltransferase CheR
MLNPQVLEDLEIELLLLGLWARFGHDLRGYARAQLKERMHRFIAAAGLNTVSGLQERMLHDSAARAAFLESLAPPDEQGGRLRRRDVLLSPRERGGPTVFADADFYDGLRGQVLPWLRTHPWIRIWVAECGSGEDVYTLAILLEEAGLYDKARIYATSVHPESLSAARAGVLDSFDAVEASCRAPGGDASLAKLCRPVDGRAVVAPSLHRHIVWGEHSLVTDASLNEFHLTVCRGGVLAGYAPRLRRRAWQLFHDSLAPFGVLASDQAPDMPPFDVRFQAMPGTGLYRRIG